MTSFSRPAFCVSAATVFVLLGSTVASAADCDNGARVAADVFEFTTLHARDLACANKTIRKPRNPREDGPGAIVYSAYAFCFVSAAAQDFSLRLNGSWNELVGQGWASIGPRKIEFDSIDSGTVINPTRRTFVAGRPLASDSGKVSLTKRGGRAATEVVVCSHGADGDTRLEHSAVIPGDAPEGQVWSPPELKDQLDRIVSIQIQPAGVGRKLGYSLRVQSGPLVEPVEETQATGTADIGPDEATLGLPNSSDAGVSSGPSSAGVALPAGGPAQLPQSIGSPAPSVENAAAPSETAGQCLVVTSRRFPELRLRCGLSPRDEVARVDEGFLADCPLVAGDSVNVDVDGKNNIIVVTSRATGGDSCGKAYQPGYYTGPCASDKAESETKQVRTMFYQGKKIVGSVIPNSCEPVRLGPGTYRVITEERINKSGSPSKLLVRESVLVLQGKELVGDVSNLLSAPFTQR